MYELADYELDAVAAGQRQGIIGNGLVVVAANVHAEEMMSRDVV